MKRIALVFCVCCLFLSAVAQRQNRTSARHDQLAQSARDPGAGAPEDARNGKTPESQTVSKQLQERLINREKDLVAAKQRHASAVIDEALADDFHEISFDGRFHDKASVMPLLPDVKIDDFTLGDFELFAIGKDSVLVTYVASMKGSFNGQAFPQKNRLSSLWLRRHGSWQLLFHQATPVSEKK